MAIHLKSSLSKLEGTAADYSIWARRSVLLEYLLSILCLLLSLYLVERTIRDTLLWTSSVPMFDQSTSVWLTNQWLTHTLPLSAIYRWHNEHLIVAPQLLFLLDIILFKNRNGFLVLCSWTLLLSHAALFLVFIHRGLRLPSALLASAVLIGALFSPTQLENFKVGFQLPYFMGQVFGTFAIALMARSSQSALRWKELIGALVCGLIASASFASGICIWPVFALLLFKMPSSKVQRLLGICAAGVITAGLIWLRASNVPRSLAIRPKLGQCWEFLSSMIGTSWSYEPSSISGIITVISILALVALIIRILSGGTLSSRAVLAAGVALFSFLWLVAVAFGRGGSGLESAHAQRYQTTVLCYLASLFLGVVEWAFIAKWPVVQGMAVAYLGALIMSIPTLHTVESAARRDAQFLQSVETSVKVGVYDPAMLSGTLLFGPKTIPTFELSRKHGYSLFADGESRWLGRPVNQLFRVEKPCTGTILERHAIQSEYPGTFLRGGKQRRGKRIIVSSEGLIVGLGMAEIQAPNTWIAFARPGSEPLEVYDVISGKSVCLIGISAN
jgi:hypothetical protein